MIICTRNGAETITAALDSLASQKSDINWELVVSDNGSADETREVVRTHPILGSCARIVDASQRLGLSHARNVGVRAAEGTYIAFVDDDDIVSSNWLTEVTRAVRTGRFVGSRLRYDGLCDHSDVKGRHAFQAKMLGSMFGYPVVNGAGSAIERSLWEAVGGNDETLRTTGEDFDFAIRVQRECGVVPVLADGAVYHHRQRSGLRASFRQGRRYGYGHVVLFTRYGPSRASRADLLRAARMWWWVLTRAPFRVASRRRATWARQLGLRVGRLQGSLAMRRWYP